MPKRQRRLSEFGFGRVRRGGRSPPTSPPPPPPIPEAAQPPPLQDAAQAMDIDVIEEVQNDDADQEVPNEQAAIGQQPDNDETNQPAQDQANVEEQERADFEQPTENIELEPPPQKRRRRHTAPVDNDIRDVLDEALPLSPGSRITRQQQIRPPVEPIDKSEEDPREWFDDPVYASLGQDDPEMAELLEAQWDRNIRTHQMPTTDNTMEMYNLRLDNGGLKLEDLLVRIFHKQKTAFYINVEFGFILLNKETGQLRYYHSADNTRVFNRDFMVKNRMQLDEALKEVERYDAAYHSFTSRPDTKWVLRQLTNAVVKVSPLPRVMGGKCNKMKLPRYIVRNKGLVNFIRDAQKNEIEDSLCFFRCLALHKAKMMKEHQRFNPETARGWALLDRLAHALFNRFRESVRHKGGRLNGMPLDMMDEAERHINIPIYIYRLKPYINEFREMDKDEEQQEDEELDPVERAEREEIRMKELEKEAIRKYQFCTEVVRRPAPGVIVTERDEQRALRLNIFTKTPDSRHAHFSYIKDSENYSKTFVCGKCNRPFHRDHHLKVHEPRCNENRVLNYFPGYGFTTKPTLFERLQHKYGIRVPDNLRYHPYYACYDWECMFSSRTPLMLETLDFGPDILPLPEPEDPDKPPDGLPIHVEANWEMLYNRSGPATEYTVVRSPAPSRIVDYMKSMAKLQRRRFRMSLKVYLFANGVMYEKHIGVSSKVITSVADFDEYWATLEPKLTKNAMGNRKIQAIRIQAIREQQDTTADLIPASCAIATNVPGYEDPDTNQPKATFLLSQGNPKNLVGAFVDTLDGIARKSGEIMLKRFGPILRRLDKLWRERYMKQIYGIVRDFIIAERPAIRKDIEKYNKRENDKRKRKPLDDAEKLRWKTLMKSDRELTKWARELDTLLKPLSVRTKRERRRNTTRVGRKQKYHMMKARSLEITPKLKKFMKKWRNLLSENRMNSIYYDAKRQIQDIQNTYKELESYCCTLTTFGFNSSKFDVNLIRDWLLPELHNRNQADEMFEPYPYDPLPMSDSYVKWRTSIKNKNLSIIKRGNAYLCIQNSRLRFLDMTNFVAAGTSYASWLASRQVEAGKFYFPYEWFTSLKQLKEPLPPQTAFYSSMKGEGISDEDYAKVKEKWRTEGWRNMRDHLEYYNTQDVVPFLAGIESMREFFKKECRIDMIGGKPISLPGISEQRIYDTVPPHTLFVLPQKTRRVDNSDLHSMVKDGIVGGPAITFRRYAEVDKTHIRDPVKGKLCKNIVGLDANSLYLKCTKMFMPCQLPRRWDRQPDGSFRGTLFYRFRQTQTEWLEWESYCRGVKIYHVFNGGIAMFGAKQFSNEKLKPEQSDAKDIRIAGVSVDGYDPTTKTCFFLDGCKWHYHLKRDENGVPVPWIHQCPITRTHKKTDEERAKAHDRRAKDYAQREHLKAEGYNVVVMAECEWRDLQRKEWKDSNQKRRMNMHGDFEPDPFTDEYIKWRKVENPAAYDGVTSPPANEMNLRQFLHHYFHLPNKKPIPNENRLLAHVKSGVFFGIVEVDIQVPAHLRDKFAELTPIFKNVDINVKDIGPHMQAHVKRHRLEKKFPRRSLIGSYFAYKVPLITPLLRWYMAHGLVVSKVHKAFQYKPIECFDNFGKLIEESRRKSDSDPLWGPSGEMDKLIGNAGYGKSITELLRHLLIEIVDRQKLREKQRDPFYKTMEPLVDKLYEVSMAKEKIENSLNNLFGFFVYNYAKLIMLSFYYDFINRFIPRADFELILMDTDSFYMALSGKGLDDLVPKKKRTAYEAVRNKFLPRREDPGKTHDRRVPGLLKIEFEGDAICANNPKTYYGVGKGGKDKWSSKGLPKKQNHLTFADYVRVLETGLSHTGRLSTFVCEPRHDQEFKKGRRLVRRDAERVGISYLYIKRIVDANGITTKPIEL